MIIVDTREQLPLWNPVAKGILSLKLDEGDYTNTELLTRAHAERKSGNDMYGSLVQNHARFRREIVRANEKNIRIAIFVECTKEEFVHKLFPGGHRLQLDTGSLRKIVTTFSDRYKVRFIWCDGRDDMQLQILDWFKYMGTKLGGVSG